MMKLAILSMAVLISHVSLAADYTLKVTEKGFDPDAIKVHAGEPVTLRITRTTDNTCAKQILVPSKKLKADLPLNKEVSLALGKVQKGELKFQCGMRMMSGSVVAE